MAEVEHKIRIITEFIDNASPDVKKAEASVLSFADAAQKAGKDVSKAFNQSNEAAKKSAQGITGLFNSLSQAKGMLLGAAAATAGLTAIMVKALHEAGEYEQAVRKLTTNLDLVGIKSRLTVTSFEEQAAALQKTTKFSDQAIVGLQSMIVSFGVVPSKIKPTTQAIVDFAAATGKSLDEAGSQVLQTFNGIIPRTGELKNLLRGLSEESLRAGVGMEKIGARFAGSAAKDVETFSGAMAQFANTIRDLLKSIGEFIIQNPVFNAVLKATTEAAKFWAETLGGNEIKGTKFTPDRGGKGFAAPSTTESSAAQSEIKTAEKLMKIEQQRLAFEEKRHALQSDANQLKDEIVKASESDQERVNREFNYRMQKLDEFAKYRTLVENGTVEQNEKKKRELQGETFKAWEKAMDENNKKQIDRDKDRIEHWSDLFNPEKSLQKRVGMVGQMAAGLQQNSAGVAVGGLLGGTIGASLGSSIEDSIKGIIKALPNILGGILEDLGSMIKGLVSSIVQGVKGGFGLVSAFKSLFSWLSGPNYFKTLTEAIAEGMDISEFNKKMDAMISGIRDTANAFRTSSELLPSAFGKLKSARTAGTSDFEKLMNEIVVNYKEKYTTPGHYENGIWVKEKTGMGGVDRRLPEALSTGFTAKDLIQMRVADPKKFQDALDSLGQELQNQAQAIMEVTNLQIDMREKALEPLRKSLENLKNLRSATHEAFGAARENIAGALKSPEQTVAELQGRFNSAKIEDKAAIGQQLAGALQGQFEAAKSLAAQGAISGEELKTIQADILAQLNAADTSSQSDFDKLIEAQQKQVDVGERQIQMLKDNAKAQIDKLDDVLQAIKSNDIDKLIKYFQSRPRFASGTRSVPETGFAMVHQGEQIIPRGGSSVVVNINGMPAGSSNESLTKAVRDILINNLGNFRGAVKRATR